MTCQAVNYLLIPDRLLVHPLSHDGRLAGHSTPTDGSTLSEADAAEGVSCDICHKMTNPDNSEHIGVQNPPFIANDGGTPPEGYYGSAQLSLSSATGKLGPYADAEPKHQWDQSLVAPIGRFLRFVP